MSLPPAWTPRALAPVDDGRPGSDGCWSALGVRAAPNRRMDQGCSVASSELGCHYSQGLLVPVE